MKAAPVKRSPASVLDWNQVSPGFAEPSPAWAPPSAGRPRGQNVPPQQQAGQFGAGGAPKSPSLAAAAHQALQKASDEVSTLRQQIQHLWAAARNEGALREEALVEAGAVWALLEAHERQRLLEEEARANEQAELRWLRERSKTLVETLRETEQAHREIRARWRALSAWRALARSKAVADSEAGCRRRHRQRTLRGSVAAWRGRVAARRFTLVKLERALLSRFLAQQRAAFDAWRAEAAAGQRRALLARHRRRRKDLSLLGASFQGWLRAACSEVTFGKLVQVVSRWLRRRLCASFGEWRARARARARRERLGRALAQRLAARRRALAFSRWAGLAAERRAREALLRRALLRAKHAAAARAFGGWLDHARALSQGKAKAAAVLRRVLLRHAHAAFRGWCEGARRRREGRAKARLAVSRALRRAEARAVRGWAERTAVARRHRAIVSRSLVRIRGRELASAFGQWAAEAAEGREGRGKETVAARFVAKRGERVRRGAVEAWREWAAGRRRKASQGRRAAAHHLGALFGAWRGRAARAAHCARAVAKASARRRKATSAAALDAWRARARRGRVVRGAEARVRRRALLSAFSAWSRRAADVAAAVRLADAQAARARLRFKGLVLSLWRGAVAAQQNTRRLVEQNARRASARQAQAAFAGAFQAWAKHAALLRTARRVAAAAALRRRHARAAACWSAWREAVARRARRAADAELRKRREVEARAAELEEALRGSYDKLKDSYDRLQKASVEAAEDGRLRGDLESALRESIAHISAYERRLNELEAENDAVRSATREAAETIKGEWGRGLEGHKLELQAMRNRLREAAQAAQSQLALMSEDNGFGKPVAGVQLSCTHTLVPCRNRNCVACQTLIARAAAAAQQALLARSQAVAVLDRLATKPLQGSRHKSPHSRTPAEVADLLLQAIDAPAKGAPPAIEYFGKGAPPAASSPVKIAWTGPVAAGPGYAQPTVQWITERHMSPQRLGVAAGGAAVGGGARHERSGSAGRGGAGRGASAGRRRRAQ